MRRWAPADGVTALSDAILPLALGGALFAAVSSQGAGTLPWRRRKQHHRGARWANRHALGTVHGRVHPALLAAERAQSVVVVGPTQSGKTTALAIPAILSWDGPV